MPRWLPLFLTTLILVSLSTAQSSIAANVIVGNCNQITGDIQAAEGSTVIVENDCTATDPSKSFRVRYLWLDSMSLSLLMAGFADENMQKIVGKRPQMYRGSIYPVLEEIFDEFGTRPTDQQLNFMGYNSRILAKGGELADTTRRTLKDLPQAVKNKLKIYSANEAIIWPDMDAFRELYETKRWPKKYKMTYGTYPAWDGNAIASIYAGGDQLASAIASCTQLYDFVKKAEFDAYMKNVSRLGNAIKAKDIGPVLGPIYTGGGKLTNSATFLSYDAMGYFGEVNWPKDYLISEGTFTAVGCSDEAGLGIKVTPRKLFVLVAVVEATGRRMKLDGLGYDVDEGKGLRRDIVVSRTLTDNFSFPAMNRGDSVIVPLRIELRYDIDQPPMRYIRPNRTSRKFFRAIQSVGGEIELANKPPFEGFPGLQMKMPSSAFREPKHEEITRTYYFGEARNLTQVIIDGNAYVVRPTPRSAMLTEAGYEVGSCPFLEFVESDGKLSHHGRILIGAHDKSKRRTERIPVPEGATNIVISEREPEVSFLSKLVLVNDETGKRHEISGPVNLYPWDRLELDIPKDLQDQKLTLEVEGYYRIITPALLASNNN